MQKNMILAIILGVGILFTILGGALGGAQSAIALFIVTLAGAVGTYAFYQSPAGEQCTPSNPDTSNVATYATDTLGVCVPSSCTDGRFLITGKDLLKKCVVPSNPPSGWDASSTSNTWANTSNIIGASLTYDTVGQCGFKCDSEPTCNIAAYSSSKKLCSLFTHDDSDPKDPAKDGDPLTLIKRPSSKK
jgi:hypothetical protein